MIRTPVFIVVAAAVFLIGGCAGAPDVPQPEEGLPAALDYIQRYADNAAGRIKNGGLGVVVVADGEVVLIEGFGSADEASDRPVTADTVFRIGSITKLFTAFAVMQLVEDGLVDLDEPYATYVPAFSIRTRSPARAITVRDMLTHHAGLPGDIFKGLAGAGNDRPDSEAAYREYPSLLDGQYAPYAPDTVFSYSNVAFSLLGILVEEVSGTPYSEYVQNEILGPLGMESSGLYAVDAFADRIATGYAPRGGDPDLYSHIRDMPAGSMHASLEDMGAFMQMIVKEGTLPAGGPSGGDVTIVAPATFAEMGRRQNATVALDFDFSIGLAFWLTNPTPVPDARLMSHSGSIPPYHAVLITAPDEDLAVLTITNADAAVGVVMDVAVESITRLLEAGRGRAFPQASLPDRPEVPIEESVLEELRGVWASPAGLIESDVRAGRLRFALSAGTVTAVHRGDGYLTPEIRILGVPLIQLYPLYFRILELDGEYHIGIYQGGILMGLATRYEPGPIPPAWKTRIGAYEILNPDEVAIVEDVKLIYDEETQLFGLETSSLLTGGTMVMPLYAVNDDLAVTAGYGRMQGEAIQVTVVDGKERIYYSGYELRKIA